MWVVASCTVRLSVLCLYYRLLRVSKGMQHRWILDLVTVMTLAHLVIFSMAMIISCE